MYYFAHKNMAKATKNGDKLLVKCIDWINAASLVLKKKQFQTQNNLLEKQLEYFKT
jgi:hypothetical protein